MDTSIYEVRNIDVRVLVDWVYIIIWLDIWSLLFKEYNNSL